MSRSWSFKCGNQFLQWGSTHLKMCSFLTLGSLRYYILCSAMSFVHCGRALLQASQYLRSRLSTSPTAKAMGHFELVAISTFANITKDYAYMETHTHCPFPALLPILLLLVESQGTLPRCPLPAHSAVLQCRTELDDFAIRTRRPSWPHPCPADATQQTWVQWMSKTDCVSEVLKRFATFRGAAQGAAHIWNARMQKQAWYALLASANITHMMWIICALRHDSSCRWLLMSRCQRCTKHDTLQCQGKIWVKLHAMSLVRPPWKTCNTQQ